MSGTPPSRIALMAASLLAVVAVCAVAVVVDARAATYVLAGVLALLALVRAWAPADAVLAVRSRPFDVVLLLAMAAAIALLAPWGNAVLPAPA